MTALSAPAAGSYKAGDALSFTLTTSSVATVETTGGTPRLELTLGTATRYATYASGTGTTSLVFTYTVQAGDADTDGIAIASTSIDLNGGTINNGSGVAIDGTLPSFTLPTIVVDTTAPDTTFDTTPANPSASVSATFTFSSADASASFAASLDGAAYAAATSPLTLTGLADGSHTFSVRAIDAAGNVDATPASFTWTVDTTAPSIPTNLAARATSPSAIALEWAASTDAIGVAGYRIYRAGTAIATCATTSYSDTGLTAATSYSYTVAAYDAAGHESAQSASATVATQSTGAQALAVASTAELEAALATAAVNPAATYTITLAAGTYTPTTGLTIGTSGLILEGGGTLSGSGLASGALLTISGGNAALSGLTFADGDVVIAAGADDGTIADCTFTGASLTGTACSGWTITGNSFSDTPAALTFSHAVALTFTENVILDCARALVLADVSSPLVRNNFIADNTPTGTTPAISLTDVTTAQIDNNSVYQAGTAASAIEYAGSGALGAIRNNLANRPITATGAATATLATNYTAAAAGWFRDVTAGDLHLAALRSAAVDAGTTIADLTVDIDGDTRPTGSAPDIGADEYQADTAAPTVPTGLAATVLSTSQITLSWTASTDTAPSGVPASGVTGYRVFRNGTAIGTSTTASYADTGLSAGTTYTYTVTAYDGAANESVASGAVRATTTAAGAPGGDKGGSGGGGAIGLLLPAALALLALGRRRFVRR